MRFIFIVPISIYICRPFPLHIIRDEFGERSLTKRTIKLTVFLVRLRELPVMGLAAL